MTEPVAYLRDAHEGEGIECLVPAVKGDPGAFPVYKERPALLTAAPVRKEAQPVWVEGLPSKHHAKEWFIAETTFGDRVVLTALPEEYTYDFKTADETYIKADQIRRWMPFPDSQYLFPTPPAPEAEFLGVDAGNQYTGGQDF